MQPEPQRKTNRQEQLDRQAEKAQQAIRDRDARRELRDLRAQLENLSPDDQRALLVRIGKSDLGEQLDRVTPFTRPDEDTQPVASQAR